MFGGHKLIELKYLADITGLIMFFHLIAFPLNLDLII